MRNLLKSFGRMLSVFTLLSALLVSVSAQNAFIYQGSLRQGGLPANGNFDFQFRLFDALSGGTQQGSTLTLTRIAVSHGLFTVSLDFGAGAFSSADRYLEIAVNGTTLSPRVKVAPASYALFSFKTWETSGSNLFYGGGSVGIGMTAPDMSLEVTRPTYYNAPALGAASGTNYAYLHVSVGDHSLIWNNTSVMRFGTETSRSMGYTELMRMTPAGYGGIGTSNPTSRLSITGDIDISGSLLYVGTDGYVGIGDTDPQYRLELPNTAGNAGRGRANAWATYSSSRWKEDIRPIDDPLGLLGQLQGVRYRWKPEQGGAEDYGFMRRKLLRFCRNS